MPREWKWHDWFGPSICGSRRKRARSGAASTTSTISPTTRKPVPFHCREDPRKRLAGHTELPCDEALLHRQTHRRVGGRLLNKPPQVATDALLRRTKLQVLRQFDLAAELRRLAAEDGEAQRVISCDCVAERFRLNKDQMRFVQNTCARQKRLSIEDCRRKQQIDRPHQLDQGFSGAADTEKRHAA